MKSPERVAKIVSLCEGKTVLDLGCYNPYGIQKRMQRNTWLHEEIRKVAKRLLGVELDPKGVEELRAQGYDVVHGDVEHCENIPHPGPVDLITAGDLIEHLSNPGLFLDSAHHLFSPGTRMILTTCNAFYWRNFLYTWQRRERVHPEHMCWYSHNTLKAVLERHGYTIEEDMFSLLKPSEFQVKTPKKLLRRLLYLRTLRFSKSLIFVVSSTRVAQA